MKKTKKSGPKAFGVRLEDCQPAVKNKVCETLNPVLILTAIVLTFTFSHLADALIQSDLQ